jgi:glutamate formiminotransferase
VASFECVVNVSEGRRTEVIADLAAACHGVPGAGVLDVHRDADHHRSVFTLAAADGDAIVEVALTLTRAACETVDIAAHDGVHPRLGAVDVVPFVAYDEVAGGLRSAIAAAHRFATVAAAELALPVFFYDAADPAGRTLPEARRDAFRSRAPDVGPPAPHPSAGAVAVGARPVLVALNCELDGSADLESARSIAAAVRERSGGLPGVRALGFWLASRATAQVSMNLVDLTRTGMEAACAAVDEQARRRGCRMVAVELVGLVPAAELARCSPEFLARTGIGRDSTVEARWTSLEGSGG